jgi:hypothetical protein
MWWEETNLGDWATDGGIILKWNLKKKNVKVWSEVDSYSSEHGQVSGSCKHGKNPLGSIYKARNL